jgi:hypothetical protein
MRRGETVVEDDCLEGTRAARTGPFLQGADTKIERVARLCDASTAAVQEIHTVERM